MLPHVNCLVIKTKVSLFSNLRLFNDTDLMERICLPDPYSAGKTDYPLFFWVAALQCCKSLFMYFLLWQTDHMHLSLQGKGQHVNVIKLKVVSANISSGVNRRQTRSCVHGAVRNYLTLVSFLFSLRNTVSPNLLAWGAEAEWQQHCTQKLVYATLSWFLKDRLDTHWHKHCLTSSSAWRFICIHFSTD